MEKFLNIEVDAINSDEKTTKIHRFISKRIFITEKYFIFVHIEILMGHHTLSLKMDLLMYIATL